MERDQGSSYASGNRDTGKLQTPGVRAYAKKVVGSSNPGRAAVMLSVTAPSGMARPVDVVLLLHVHMGCTAPSTWHSLICEATRRVVNKLGDNDRLALVPALSKETITVSERAIFSKQMFVTSEDPTSTETPLMDLVTSKRTFTVPAEPKLRLMSTENKKAVDELVNKSPEPMRSYTPLAALLETAESILNGRQPGEKENRAGHIVVISNSNEDLSTLLIWRFPSVHAFGFWDAHNARTMRTIARGRESTCGILDEGDDVSPAFTASIDKITSTVVPAKIGLKCGQEAALSTIAAPRVCYFVSKKNKVGTIWANVRSDGVPTNFMLHLDIDRDDYPESKYGTLLAVHVECGRTPGTVVILKGPPLVHISKGMVEYKEFAAELVRMEVLKIAAHITMDDGKKDYEEVLVAADHMRQKLMAIQELREEAANSGLTSRLEAEIREMETRLHNNFWWHDYILPRSRQWWPPLHQSQTQPAITDRSLLRLQIMAKIDGIPVPIIKTLLPVLIHVMAPVEGLAKEKRAPLDLVTVIGVSCREKKMMSKRLGLLNKAMEFLMHKLGNIDRLAIICVQSALAHEPSPLSNMTTQGRRKHTAVLSTLTSEMKKAEGQTTHLRDRFKQAIPSLVTANTSAAAEGGSTQLSKSLMKAFELLECRQEDEKHRMGSIIVISDNNDTFITQQILNPRYAVHTFSFRGANNARGMHHIASSSGGIFAILDDQQNKITEAFTSCINYITSTIAVNTKVNIRCNNPYPLKLYSINSGKFRFTIDDSKKYGSIFAGALYGGAERRFIVYVENVTEGNYENLSQMLTCHVTWQHASSRVDASQYSTVEIIRDEDNRSKEIIEEIVRNEVINIVSVITDSETEAKDFTSILRKLQDLHKNVRVQLDSGDLRMRRQRLNYAFPINEEILVRLANDSDGSWLSYIMSWLSFQDLCEKPPLAPSMMPQWEKMGDKVKQGNVPQKHDKLD